jgi:hypothetical protein
VGKSGGEEDIPTVYCAHQDAAGFAPGENRQQANGDDLIVTGKQGSRNALVHGILGKPLESENYRRTRHFGDIGALSDA